MQDIIGQIDFDITELYYDDKLQKPANCCECVVHTENARNIINKLLKFPLFFEINKPIIIATETALLFKSSKEYLANKIQSQLLKP